MNHGFVKVAAAIPLTKVADCRQNAQEIKNLIVEAEEKRVHIVVFPELSITGYSCGDLFAQHTLQQNALTALKEITDFTSQMEVIAIVGLPLRVQSSLFNTAAIIHKGKIAGFVPKGFIPCHHEHNERRWFAPASMDEAEIAPFREICNKQFKVPMGKNLLFETPETTFAIEIGEDLWSALPTGTAHALAGAEIIFNLAAYTESIGKYTYLQSLLSQQSARTITGYVYASSGYGESTTDTVFGGNGLIYECGTQLASSERFSLSSQLIVSEIDVERIRHDRMTNNTFADCATYQPTANHHVVAIEAPAPTFSQLSRQIDDSPFIPKGKDAQELLEEIFNIQVTGLCRRIEHTHCQSAVIGISGGLDSTLALLVCVKAFDKLKRSRKEIFGITMPGFGTTGRTYNNALHLMKSLGVTIREISIREACLQHFSDIGHDEKNHDVTYENSQARERTQILMDIANQTNGLVIGTGDLSELALGWATYNGDHMSMYGVNAGVPKTLVQHLTRWIADNEADKESANTLYDIIDTPISPELTPADEQGNIKQKTEDLVGPYELHDFFIYRFMRFGNRPSKIYFLAQQAFGKRYKNEVIKKWLTTFCRRFFNQQFKRSCLPDGPKVGSVSLSPRGDWQMPSDASSNEWLQECEQL